MSIFNNIPLMGGIRIRFAFLRGMRAHALCANDETSAMPNALSAPNSQSGGPYWSCDQMRMESDDHQK
jgi:hypothetical protein